MNELEQVRWLIAEIEHTDQPTDDDVTRLDTLISRAETLVEEQRAEQERAARIENIRRHAEDPRNLEPAIPVPNVTQTSTRDVYDLSDIRLMGRQQQASELRGRAREIIERSTMPCDDSARENAMRLIERRDTPTGDLARHVIVHDNPHYRSAFAKAMTYVQPVWTTEEARAVDEARAMDVGTGADGGFMLPTLVDPTIILTNDGTANPIRAIARTVQIVGNNTWAGVSSAGVTASYDAELAEVSDDTPTLAQPSITCHKAQAFVPFSIEAQQDIASLSTDVAMMFNDAKERLEASKFTNGGGDASNEPLGIVFQASATTASRVAATTNDTFGLVDVYNTIEGLAPRHRPRASWMADYAIINDIRQFATANNYHGFLTDLVGDSPRQLLGKPLYENSDMDGTLGTGNDDILIVGDFSKYVIVDRIGFAVELVPHLFATGNNRPDGSRGWYGYWRNGAEPVDINAFRILRV